MQTKLKLALLLATIPAAAQSATQTAPIPAPAPDNTARSALIQSIDELAAKQTATRRDAVAKIKTKAEAQQRQAEVRKKMLALLGPLPAKTPLNPKITGTVPLTGFHIEKLTFESQPGFHVTALLYLPDNPTKKLPAIVVAPGHGATGKAGDYGFASTFARNGFAVLSYDPLGQGERLQYPDPANPGKTLSKGPTGEHGEAGLQPVLLGESVAKYMLWDGIRAVDYLQSRPEIDPTRIGAFGCSGGGAMTALLGALDPRIAATGTACYITSFDTLLPGVGPQDGEQSTPGWIAAGLDFPDWIELAAPRPYAVISTASDMFPFTGALTSVAEARRFYALFDPASAGTRSNLSSLSAAEGSAVPIATITGPTLNPDTRNTIPPTAKLQFITGIGGHGNLRPIQSQIVAFFLTHLAHSDAAPILPPPPAPGTSPFALPPEVPKDAFQVTQTGQVSTSFPGAETVFSLNLKHAQALPKPRVLAGTGLQSVVQRTLGGVELPISTAAARRALAQNRHADAKSQCCGALGFYPFASNAFLDSVVEHNERPVADATRYDITVSRPDHPNLTFTLGVPSGKGPFQARLLLLDQPLLYSGVNGAMQSSLSSPDEAMFNHLLAAGNLVLALSSSPSPAGGEELKSPLLGSHYLLGLRSELTGKTILGMRVEETIKALDYLANLQLYHPDDITAEASGHEALVLLHAAILDPRLKHVTLTHLPPSYHELLANPMPTDAPQDILPAVLLHYDTPDLIRALGTRVTVLP